MFRELTRKKQTLSDIECKEILLQEVRGVLAVNGDSGYPYALPINYYFDEENNKIYLHSGKVGHKMDALANSEYNLQKNKHPLIKTAASVGAVVPFQQIKSRRFCLDVL